MSSFNTYGGQLIRRMSWTGNRPNNTVSSNTTSSSGFTTTKGITLMGSLTSPFVSSSNEKKESEKTKDKLKENQEDAKKEVELKSISLQKSPRSSHRFLLHAAENKRLHERYASISPDEFLVDYVYCQYGDPGDSTQLNAGGKIYLTNKGMHFRGKNSSKNSTCVKFSHITQITKPHSGQIEIHADDKVYLFHSFNHRDQAFEMLTIMWKHQPESFLNNSNIHIELLKVRFKDHNYDFRKVFPKIAPSETLICRGMNLKLYNYEGNSAQSTTVYVTKCFLCIKITAVKGEEKLITVGMREIKSIDRMKSGIAFSENTILVTAKRNKTYLLELNEDLYHLLNFLSDYAKSRPIIFGESLARIIKREKADIPIPGVLTKIVEYLCQPELLKSEGLFRLSGELRVMENLAHLINDGTYPEFSEYSPHTVAGLLKKYLRELPAPLLTFELTQCFVVLKDIQAGEEEKVQKLKNLMENMLSEPNYCISDYLLGFLSVVASYVKQNKMTAENLGVIFGPILIQEEEKKEKKSRSTKGGGKEEDEGTASSFLLKNSAIIEATTLLIKHHNKIFDREGKQYPDACGFFKGMHCSPSS